MMIGERDTSALLRGDRTNRCVQRELQWHDGRCAAQPIRRRGKHAVVIVRNPRDLDIAERGRRVHVVTVEAAVGAWLDGAECADLEVPAVVPTERISTELSDGA